MADSVWLCFTSQLLLVDILQAAHVNRSVYWYPSNVVWLMICFIILLPAVTMHECLYGVLIKNEHFQNNFLREWCPWCGIGISFYSNKGLHIVCHSVAFHPISSLLDTASADSFSLLSTYKLIAALFRITRYEIQ